MPDDADPPRKSYTLKPRAFESVNSPTSTPAPGAGPTDVQGMIRAANAPRLPASPAAKPSGDVNDVQALLRENHARADAAGLNDVTLPPKRRSRRTRDYWLLLVPVNAFFAWAAFGPGANAMTFVYGIGGMGLYTAALTWVMFFVMDDY